jgi:hypothetical protein
MKRSLIGAAGIAGIVFCGFLTSCSILSSLVSGIPSAPTGVAASTPAFNANANSGSGGYQTTITWSSDFGAVSYYVYHTYGNPSTVGEPTEATGGGPGPSTFESNAVTGTSYTFIMGASDPSGNIFHFAVSAVGSNGVEGPLSATATVSVP